MNNTSATNSIEKFSEWQKEQGKAEGTVKTYVGILEKFQAWLHEKDSSLEQISTNDVQLYMDYLEEQEKSAGTIEKYLAAISVFSRYLGRSEIISGVHKKEKIKDTDIPESLEEMEEKRLLLEVELEGNLRNIAIVYTLLYTGIRISELCALNVADIEINNKKGTLFVKNHNGELERIIPLSKEVTNHLKRYIDTLNTKQEALFASNSYNRISTRAVQYMLQKYNVNPHKLRHTFCQKLINKGIDIQTVAKLAGHKDINVTKRYASAIEPNLKNAIDRAFS
ncbi:tyrosine-type recombinase/integrase [Metabacillus sp. Hm71]|uniref:tyrosine-type recombinase/integrase n=1 Tax=Metabacillus sp. Hm71 TaxID=3450743 RepID=UPI003F4244A8